MRNYEELHNRICDEIALEFRNFDAFFNAWTDFDNLLVSSLPQKMHCFILACEEV
jgi:hypothetical protein